MSGAKCRPNHHFLNCLGPPPPSSSPSTAHLPPSQLPTGQSESVPQLGAASHVPSRQRRPALHCAELSQLAPQSRLPCFSLPLSQPGKSGGQISLAAQRFGGCVPGNAGGASLLSSTIVSSIGAPLLPQLATSLPP